MKIVDDDVDLRSLPVTSADPIDDPPSEDEAPTVANFIDERPEDVQIIERFRDTNRWKGLGDGNGLSPLTPHICFTSKTLI